MDDFRATKVIFDKGLTTTVDCTSEVKQHIADFEQQLATLREALISIATQGCESDFDDDQEICSTLSGYCHDDWCNPCLANEALEPTND